MVCFCRVSTHRQKVDSQKADILRWLTGHAVAPAAIQWTEDVESGTTLKRPAFDRMQRGSSLALSGLWWSGDLTGFRGDSARG